MKRAAAFLLVVAALAMLVYRLAHLDSAPFARDEPQFLAAARDQLRTGQWLTANPLFGNLGMRYGAASFWFYGVVQLLFGDAPRTALFAMSLALTLAYLALAVALTRLLDEGALFFAVLLAWIASSPYLFHWSRMAWDLTSLAAVFGAAALLCANRELRLGRAIALGLLLGIAASTHPSVVPFVFAAGAVLFFEWRARRLTTAPAAALAASFVLVCLPYAWYLLHARRVRRAPPVPLTLADFGDVVFMAPRIASTWELERFYDEDWHRFRTELGGAVVALEALAVVSFLACLAGAILGLRLALSSTDTHRRRLARIALLTWCGTVVLLTGLGLDRHVHYQFSAAWVPAFAVACALRGLRESRPRVGALALACVGALALCQFALVLRWQGYLRAHGGTRSPAYGTTLGAQREAMKSACAFAEPVVVMENETFMYHFPFAYLATTEEACRGKQVIVCGGLPDRHGPPCPAPTPGAARVFLRYSGNFGGAVRVVR
jgi:4-amino-4-deoxy-L-arabinose transferase-like glycosyltransferase